MAEPDVEPSGWLELACAEAGRNHAPSGAVLVKDGALVSQSHYQCESRNDPIATAEMDCIRLAGRRSDQSQLTLYTTRYPDLLCAGTVIQFGIGRVVVGLPESTTDGVRLLREEAVPISFVSHPGCQQLDEA